MNNKEEHPTNPHPTADEPQSPQGFDSSEHEPPANDKTKNSQPESSPVEEQPKTQKETAEKKPPTRFQRFLRKALIILGVVGLIFLAGFLTDHFVRYRPLSDTLKETRTELEQVNQTLKDLEAENASLRNANRAANESITTLEDELADTRTNAQFYQVLVDVNTARIELFLENIEGAQAALADTQDNLEALLPSIVEVDPELGLSLPRRLDLIVSGLARDPETGLIELELFTKYLLELKPLLDID